MASFAAAREEAVGAGAAGRRPLEAGEVAWLAVLPLAALVVAAIVLLGPPLGHAAMEPGSTRFWPWARAWPEPVEHARFLLALLGAPLLAAAIVVGHVRPPRLRPAHARALVALTQVATLLLLALTLLAQHEVLLNAAAPPGLPSRIFRVPTILAALALAVAAGVALARPAAARGLAALARETRGRRVGCLLVAILLSAVWLSAAFNTEHSIGRAEAHHLIPWDMSETFAVLDGRTPLLDYHSQYAQIVPYLAAGALRLVGTSVGAWTGTMIVFSGLALLAVFAVLRRIARSSLAALALWVLFLAGTAFLALSRLSPLEIFSLWPMRYGGPYLLAWLTTRHLDGAAPRRRWIVAGAAGLVALNNLEFGLPACAGAITAMAYTDPPRSWRAAGRFAAEMALGLLAALVAVTLLTLAHGGGLPHLSLLLEFPRIYGVDGWVLEPMAPMGLHVALLVTFMAAVAVATVRAVRGEEGAALTGMLVFSGIFGLGAGSYYAGRSDVLNLTSLFSTWCFALVLLTVVVVRGALRSGRRPSPAGFAVLFGCGLFACAILQLPQPWRELHRVRQTTTSARYKQAAAVRLVKATTIPGQKVVILTGLGHRVAFDAGVVDVAPYSGFESMPTVGQLARTIDVARREGVTQIYIDDPLTFQGFDEALNAAGFVATAEEGRYVMLTGSPPSG